MQALKKKKKKLEGPNRKQKNLKRKAKSQAPPNKLYLIRRKLKT